MARAGYRFTADVWKWTGNASWHFVSLPEEIADEIDERYGEDAGGFGSIRVKVTIGKSVWRTSLFPDTKRATYLLPLKKAVRVANGLDEGTTADVGLIVIAGDE